MHLMDDDSDNDSDYVPEQDGDEDSVTGKKKQEGVSIHEQILSKKRKRKVDSIWDELQEEEKQYLEKRRSLDTANFQDKILMEIPCRKRSKRQIAMLLYEVFGSANSLDVLPESRVMEDVASSSAEALKQAAENCVRNLKKTVVVQETRRFAGQEVVIEKKVMKSQDDIAKEEKKEEKNLDRLIETLKGPKAISTVTKSSADWEVYKEKEGIADEDLAAAKDGFIAKNAFLNNCDVASFEQEKAMRQTLRKI